VVRIYRGNVYKSSRHSRTLYRTATASDVNADTQQTFSGADDCEECQRVGN